MNSRRVGWWTGMVLVGVLATAAPLRSAWADQPALAPTTQAVEGSEGGATLKVVPDIGELVMTVIIFVGLLLVLRVVAWKPILQGLQSREAAIRDGVEAAAKARAEAERTTKELEAKIAEAQRIGAQALAQAKADALKLAEAIKTQAEAESSAMKDRALRDIDAAKQQAVTEINLHAADLGTAIARKILQRNVTVDDQQKLVDEALGQMAARNN